MRGVAKECRDGCIGFGEMCWCMVTIISGKIPPAEEPPNTEGAEDGD